ncbi:MAG: antitoxin Xre/MbcA/ParS toxin-binding domain-containing protein [Saprospiraceae bacterium]
MQNQTANLDTSTWPLGFENEFSIIKAVRLGISNQVFDEIVARSPFSAEEWLTFLPVSQHLFGQNDKGISPLHSDLIFQIALLAQKGREVFGSDEKFSRWANRPNAILQGQKPKELLDTTFGINLVRDEIGRIEHGIFA